MRCLDAITGEDVRPAQIVVVDQSDGHETERIIAGRLSSTPGLTYVRQRRRGLSASRNRAVDAATQPIVAFTDDDCVPGPKWVEAIEAALSAHEEVAAVTGAVHDLGPDSAGMVASSLRRGTAVRTFRRRALPWRVGTGGNLAARREWLARVGPFDERLGAGSPGHAAEDMDLIHRLLRSGASIRFDPAVVVRHARHTRRARLASRWSYGYGMGAFCAKWFRRRDPFAAVIWARWIFDRGWVLAASIRRRRWDRAREQILYIRGGGAGFLHGLARRDR